MTEKVGRNDPCPCGSGKKYKQCCLKNQLPGGRKKIKAKIISSGKKPPDLMERTFGSAIRSANEGAFSFLEKSEEEKNQ